MIQRQMAWYKREAGGWHTNVRPALEVCRGVYGNPGKYVESRGDQVEDVVHENDGGIRREAWNDGVAELGNFLQQDLRRGHGAKEKERQYAGLALRKDGFGQTSSLKEAGEMGIKQPGVIIIIIIQSLVSHKCQRPDIAIITHFGVLPIEVSPNRSPLPRFPRSYGVACGSCGRACCCSPQSAGHLGGFQVQSG